MYTASYKNTEKLISKSERVWQKDIWVALTAYCSKARNLQPKIYKENNFWAQQVTISKYKN
jgi:hypothetical protein